jgi:hypothetical protein
MLLHRCKFVVAMKGLEADNDDTTYECDPETLFSLGNAIPHSFDSFAVLLKGILMMCACFQGFLPTRLLDPLVIPRQASNIKPFCRVILSILRGLACLAKSTNSNSRMTDCRFRCASLQDHSTPHVCVEIRGDLSRNLVTEEAKVTVLFVSGKEIYSRLKQLRWTF